MDYRDYISVGKRPANTDRPVGYWWQQQKKSPLLHESVLAAAKYIEAQQATRDAMNIRHARLYGNFDLIGLGLRDYTQSTSGPYFNQVALNLVASCIDTLTAKIAKNRPRATFQTFGGSRKMQKQAQNLDKFVQGVMYEAKTYEESPLVFRDACVFGTGARKWYIDEDTKRLCAERTPMNELFVDDAEGIYGRPRQMFQRKWIAREVVCAANEDVASDINSAEPSEYSLMNVQGFGDMIEVWECWHLPSGKNAKDGRHAIVCNGATLLDEPWNRPYFPFSFMRLYRPLMGFYGQGLAERLCGLQIEINRILRDITESLRLGSQFRVLVERSSNVQLKHINNRIGTILHYTGIKPEWVATNVVTQETLMQLDRLWQRGFEESGISQLSAAMQKPAGLNASVALETYNDIESERFVTVGQQYEQFHLDDAFLAIDMARDIAKKQKKYGVRAPTRGRVEYIDLLKDVNLDESDYVMQAFPVSSLPQTPAARRQEVFEWIQQGWVDSVQGRRLMNLPDLDAADSIATAAMDDVDEVIGKILDDGEMMAPEEIQDLELLLKTASSAYLRARHQDVPPENLEKLQALIVQTSAMLQAKQPTAPTQLALPGMDPGMPPGAPPPAGPAGPMPPGAPPIPQAA